MLFRSDQVREVPWKPQPETDDEVVRARFLETGIDGSQVQPAVGLERPYLPRRVYIRADVELAKYGATIGCDGCRMAEAGLPRTRHTEECRARITKAMQDDEAGRLRLQEAEQRKASASGGAEGDPGNKRRRADRKSTRLNSSHSQQSRMPSSA